MQINIEEAAMLLGKKEMEVFLLEKQIAVLSRRVAELEEKLRAVEPTK